MIDFKEMDWLPKPGFYKFNAKLANDINDAHIKDYIREHYGKVKIYDRTKCIDIFATVKVDNRRMYAPSSSKSLTCYKLKKKMLEEMINRIRFHRYRHSFMWIILCLL